MSERPRLSLIGLGPMGTALARALLVAGCDVRVWNRSPGRAEALRASGATVASSAAEAIAGSPLAVMCVRDAAAARAVLDTVEVSGALSGKVLVQMSTLPLEEVRAQAAWLGQRGARFVMGCISAYPDAVGRDDAVYLYAGDPDAFAAQRPVLDALGGRLLWLGADPCAVPAAYCSYGAFALGSIVLFLEGHALARHLGVSTADFRALARLATDLVLDRIDASSRRLESGDFSGDHATVDTTLAAMQDFMGEFRRASITALASEAATGQLARLATHGMGDADIAVLATLLGSEGTRRQTR